MHAVTSSVRVRVAAAPRHGRWDTGWRRLPHVLLERPRGGAWHCERPGAARLTVPDGHLLVLPRECMHRLVKRPGPDMDSSWCYCDWWQSPGVPLTLPTRPLVLPPPQAAILDDILLPGVGLSVDIRQQRALLQLLEAVCAIEPPPPPTRLDPRIVALLHWCTEHLHEPISRGDLARVAGLSPTRLHAVFSAELGQAPMRWLAEQRLQRARQLLLSEPATAVGSIASRCGFSSPYWFSRAFNAAIGSSPSRWRAAMLAADGTTSTP